MNGKCLRACNWAQHKQGQNGKLSFLDIQMGTTLSAQSYKSRGSPTEFLWRFKSFRQTLPFTWVTLTAQLTNLCLMELNFVHMTETINIKAQAQVTAAHLLSVSTRPGLPRSTLLFSPYRESGELWCGSPRTQCSRLQPGDISKVSSSLWFLWNLRCPLEVSAKG